MNHEASCTWLKRQGWRMLFLYQGQVISFILTLSALAAMHTWAKGRSSRLGRRHPKDEHKNEGDNRPGLEISGPLALRHGELFVEGSTRLDTTSKGGTVTLGNRALTSARIRIEGIGGMWLAVDSSRHPSSGRGRAGKGCRGLRNNDRKG